MPCVTADDESRERGSLKYTNKFYCFEDSVNFRQHTGKTWSVIRLKLYVPSTVRLRNLTAPNSDKLTELFKILWQGILVVFFSIN